MGADAAAIWAWLVRADLWPRFYRHSSSVRYEGGAARLGSGVAFRWRTLGVPLRSVVIDFEAAHRIVWSADGPGIRAVHAWWLSPSETGTILRTEETQHGVLPALFGWFIRRRLSAAHAEWLAALGRVASEAPPPPPVRSVQLARK